MILKATIILWKKSFNITTEKFYLFMNMMLTLMNYTVFTVIRLIYFEYAYLSVIKG